jgi:hypothetical protein
MWIVRYITQPTNIFAARISDQTGMRLEVVRAGLPTVFIGTITVHERDMEAGLEPCARGRPEDMDHGRDSTEDFTGIGETFDVVIVVMRQSAVLGEVILGAGRGKCPPETEGIEPLLGEVVGV